MKTGIKQGGFEMGKEKTPIGNYAIVYGKANKKNKKTLQPKPLYYLQINFAKSDASKQNPLFYVGIGKRLFQKKYIYTTCYGMGVAPTFFTSKRKVKRTIQSLLKINPRITSVQTLFLDMYAITTQLFNNAGYLKVLQVLDENEI